MMKLGIICSNPTKDAVAYVKGLGLSCVEICNNNNEETLNCHANMADYIANVREAGLFFSSVGRWNSNMNAAGRVNEEEFAIVSKTLEDAIAAEAPTFVCGCNYDDSVSLYRNYSAAIEIFGRLAEKAKGTKTSVAIYNCDWNNFVHDIETWKVVLGELPDVKIKFDASIPITQVVIICMKLPIGLTVSPTFTSRVLLSTAADTLTIRPQAWMT